MESALVEDFETAVGETNRQVGDVVVVERSDERLILTRRGSFNGQVLPDDGNRAWQALTHPDDLVRFHDPTDLFGDVAEALANLFPGLDTDLAPDPLPRRPRAHPSIDTVEPEALERVVVVTYSGRTQEDAASHFAEDAAVLAEDGYAPTSQSWADGRSGCLRFILLGGFGALIFKPDGTLTVTYQLREPDTSRR
jgi:hypothetical protein